MAMMLGLFPGFLYSPKRLCRFSWGVLPQEGTVGSEHRGLVGVRLAQVLGVLFTVSGPKTL